MKYIISLVLLLLSFAMGYGSFLLPDIKLSMSGIFLSGMFFGMFLINLRLMSKNDRLNSYKRELERESVTSDEAGAKVKVLESKIKVLEKALEDALKK